MQVIYLLSIGKDLFARFEAAGGRGFDLRVREQSSQFILLSCEIFLSRGCSPRCSVIAAPPTPRQE